MEIEIREVNEENLNDILSLRVHDHQKAYIETPFESLEDAKKCSYYKSAGLYVDKALVGFAMFGFFPQEDKGGRVWFDRYLIDKKYQGRGLGRILLTTLIEYLVQRFNCSEIYLSIYQDNIGALSLYKKLGFEFNGEMDINGEMVMVKKL
ncbi:Spermine/spermidine acetyltransferase [Paenibacillus auburnensis]|uniref:Spermine/spermidine acetyltransferase n=1 Tax=Paenibacillus auburnensis TaxID=2905649 RepID=A0ABM9CBZ4_9BACL|nr:GNAT family N-acetyltransferase [Paenibacillus auburnensis]CAH1208416.1 Spermine/spermidine acetyltransferase [Paenibacillus auburnensis]